MTVNIQINTPIFETSFDQQAKLRTIASKMESSGISKLFLKEAVALGEIKEGVFDLFEMWDEAESEDEKKEIIADIHEEVEDDKNKPLEPTEKLYVGSNELEDISNKISRFKNSLKVIIDRDHGGINKAAAKIGMEQSSLSRFLNSSSMPRRTTLFRIAKALNLSEREIAFDWLR